METILLLSIFSTLTKSVLLTTESIDLQTPSIIERSFKVGDTIKITYKYRYSYLVTIGKPKFYINLQLLSQRKFHSTTPGLYALGQSGTVEYTALEAGVHKLFVWTFNDKCKYIVALGKQEYNQDRVISPSPWAFIETDPDKEMTIKSDGLSSYTWVHWYSGTTSTEVISTEIKPEWGPFDRKVSRFVRVQCTNAAKVKVTITSDGNSEYDYGEYGQDQLDASTIPFFYTSQDQKQNMLDDFYVPVKPGTNTPTNPTSNPSKNPTSNPNTSPTSNPNTNPTSNPSSQINTKTDSYTNPPNQGGNAPLNPTENPGNEEENSDGDSKGGLSGGAWAGIGTAAAAGCGGIATAITFLVKKVLKKPDASSQEGENQIEITATADVKNDNKSSIKTGDNSKNNIYNNNINCCNIY